MYVKVEHNSSNLKLDRPKPSDSIFGKISIRLTDLTTRNTTKFPNPPPTKKGNTKSKYKRTVDLSLTSGSHVT